MTDLFKSTPGSTSFMRVAFFLTMIASFVMAGFAIYFKFQNPKESVSDLATMISIIMSFAFIGKAGQSFSENKFNLDVKASVDNVKITGGIPQ